MDKKVNKIFFVWQEKEERKFLEDMALNGYILTKYKLGKYYFKEETPREVIYQFDFKGIDNISEKEYLQIYEDSGWNNVKAGGGWYYFYIDKKENIDTHIFSNNKSVIQKYRRVLGFLMLTGFPIYYQLIIVFPNMDSTKLVFPKFYFFVRIFIILLTVLHLFGIIKVIKLINLNKKITE